MNCRTITSSWLLVVIAWFAATAHGQIYETVCRDANCTDVALGPLALIPQCYRTPQGSVRLSINAANSDVLDLCVHASDDCSESTTDTCYAFLNSKPDACPFFKGLNGQTLFVVFEWDIAAVELAMDSFNANSRRQLTDVFSGLTEYGNWCGPGHGGTNDCCDGNICSQCNDSIGLTSTCQAQCPTEDGLDFACAMHDFCYGFNDYEKLFDGFECTSFFGVQKSGPCRCDCRLIKTARTIDDTNDLYKSAVILVFTHITNCWYNTTTSGPVCNTQGSDRILVTEFC